MSLEEKMIAQGRIKLLFVKLIEKYRTILKRKK